MNYFPFSRNDDRVIFVNRNYNTVCSTLKVAPFENFERFGPKDFDVKLIIWACTIWYKFFNDFIISRYM